MSRRSEMLATEIRSIVAPALRECPPECGMASITVVDVSTDTSFATVYISALNHPEKALEFLQEKRKELQWQLSKLQRRVIPTLRFRIDDTIAQGVRIDQLLEEANKQLPHDSSTSTQQ